MRLRDLLDESVVKIGLESTDKEECFEELIDLLVRSGRLASREAALAAVAARESTATTGIGRGCAIPHGKDPSIKTLTVAIGTSAAGIEFDAVDGELVHLVILILANADEPGPHVQALAEVVRLLKLPGCYNTLVAARSAKALLDAIDAVE
ncbi:MAG: PTS transporter subunit EIIA [Lentisphaerae bacterium]|jgi:mannitol/fructose-specific phosphotransferase system IIA component (Ntr-type)|nr:PTS transporter subunit EIIA [Lentisphaerota bacterium]